MRYLLIVLVAFTVLIFPSIIGAQITFERWYGGTGNDRGCSVAQTSDGGYIIAGYTESFGAGFYDVYLIKTDSLGDTVWTKTYGGIFSDGAYSIDRTSDGGCVISGKTESFGTGGVYLLKINSAGDTIWTKTYGGGSDVGNSVVQTTDGCYIIAGITESFGAGGEDVYLIKTDENGDSLWIKTYGGTGHDGGYSVVQTSDKGYVITGYTNSFGAGDFDIYLIKTDSLGDTIWTRTFGDFYWDQGYSVIQTSEGDYIISGRMYFFSKGSDDVCLIKVNSFGNTAWLRKYGGFDWDSGLSVAQTSDGCYITAGYTESFGAGGADVYLIKTDSLGNVAGIEEEKDQRHKTTDIRLICHPNPFTTEISIKCLGISEKQKVTLEIYDVSGRLIKSVLLTTDHLSLSTDFVPGIYFLKADGVNVGKVVKVR